MNNYRVSVLVTFYNQADCVDKALGSIVSQKTTFGVKIIIGDDGSSDGTCDIVRKWIQRYPDSIELHVMDRDNGVNAPGFRASRNRINLINYVDTDYYMFLDGDDYYCYEEKLQKQVDILDSKENADCIACGHNTGMLYKNGIIRPFTDSELKEGKIDPQGYWKKYHIHTDALLFRKSVISHIDTGLLENGFNDNMITFPALRYGKIYYINEVWAYYVQTDDGIWTGGEEVINLVRQMIFYDLSNRINPRMKNQTICKFGYAWEGLYEIRHCIDTDKLVEYADEARDKGCKNALSWICYPGLGMTGRLGLLIKTWFIKLVTPLFYRL